jgi:hypothetical protein
MLDGLISPGEWDNALTFEAGLHAKILLRQDGDYFYIGIDCRDVIRPSINLELAEDSTEVWQFHVGAQIGERIVTRESTRRENPTWLWSYSDNWMANEMRWDYDEMDRLKEEAGGEWLAEDFAKVAFPSHGAEYQFRKTRFDASRYYFRLHLFFLDPPGHKLDPVVFPEGTAMGDITGWAVLEL